MPVYGRREKYCRGVIREGDTVVPGGGFVRPSPQAYPAMYFEKLASFEGDPVFCNTCQSWGVTKCIPPLRPNTDSRGRQANLDGDLCICKCPTPPRLKSSLASICVCFEEKELEAIAGAIPWRIYAGHSVDEHEIIYEIVDAVTGKALEGMTYKLTSAGRTLVDSQLLNGGKTEARSLNNHLDLAFIAWIRRACK